MLSYSLRLGLYWGHGARSSVRVMPNLDRRRLLRAVAVGVLAPVPVAIRE